MLLATLQIDGLRVQLVGFVVRLGGVGLLHQVRGLLYVFFLLGFNLLDLLADRVQIFGLLVVALVAMAAHAAALTEQILAVVDGLELHVAAGQHHVGGVAGLAARLRIFFGIQRPQPMLVISVRLFDAGGGASIALVAGRTAKLLRIVNLQQLRLGMADERLCVFVRLLLALAGHGRGRDFQRLARVHVARLASVNDVGIGHVDLHDRRIPVRRPFLQSLDLLRSQVDHVIGDVFIHLGLGCGDWLQHVAEFQAQLRPLVADFVVRSPPVAEM